MFLAMSIYLMLLNMSNLALGKKVSKLNYVVLCEYNYIHIQRITL